MVLLWDTLCCDGAAALLSQGALEFDPAASAEPSLDGLYLRSLLGEVGACAG